MVFNKFSCQTFDPTSLKESQMPGRVAPLLSSDRQTVLSWKNTPASRLLLPIVMATWEYKMSNVYQWNGKAFKSSLPLMTRRAVIVVKELWMFHEMFVRAPRLMAVWLTPCEHTMICSCPLVSQSFREKTWRNHILVLTMIGRFAHQRNVLRFGCCESCCRR